MTRTAGFSTAEIRAYLTEYDMIPFGQKGTWVDSQLIKVLTARP